MSKTKLRIKARMDGTWAVQDAEWTPFGTQWWPRAVFEDRKKALAYVEKTLADEKWAGEQATEYFPPRVSFKEQDLWVAAVFGAVIATVLTWVFL